MWTRLLLVASNGQEPPAKTINYLQTPLNVLPSNTITIFTEMIRIPVNVRVNV